MEMSNNIKEGFEQLFKSMIQEGIIRFPTHEQITKWEEILDKWINDKSLPLFRRKPSGGRGSELIHEGGRTIVITDNTPAHWVYKTATLKTEKLLFSSVKNAIQNKTFPIAMMAKKTEKGFLQKSQVIDSSFRLGNENWKVAHILPIALPKQQNLTINQYEEHHRKFLSLNNMYLIRKELSGIAEVSLFNEIIIRYKNELVLV